MILKIQILTEDDFKKNNNKNFNLSRLETIEKSEDYNLLKSRLEEFYEETVFIQDTSS